MFKTFIKMLTPFIMSIFDITNGVMFYISLKYDVTFDNRIYSLFGNLCGSSLLVIFYIMVNSTHMCKYYKTACILLLIKHLVSISYLYTELTQIEYTYIILTLSTFSLVCWTISVLGYKTYKTIHQSCKR